MPKVGRPKRQQFPNTGGWHDRRSRSCVRRPGGNPCSLAEISLFPNVGNSPARTSSGAGSETLASPEAGIWTTSLHFPSRSGIFVQRRVRYRLVPPPFSLLLQRFSARTRAQPEKSPRIRGVLADQPSRNRTGDGGFGASKAQHPGFFSVGKLAGSDSLQTRLGVLRVRDRLRPPPFSLPAQRLSGQ